MTRRSSDEQVYRISGAPRSLTDDVDERTRRYLYSMGLRTICFIGAVVLWVVLDQVVLACILLAGAVLLPYLAVVVANAGRERRVTPPTTVLTDSRPELPPTSGPTSD